MCVYNSTTHFLYWSNKYLTGEKGSLFRNFNWTVRDFSLPRIKSLNDLKNYILIKCVILGGDVCIYS